MLMLLLAYRNLLPYLEPFGAGQYFYIQSYVLLFATIVDFGIQQFITKKISEQPQRAKEYFQNFFCFEVLVSLLLYVVLVSIAYTRHFNQAVFYGIAVAGLGMVANALAYPFMAVMAAFQDMRKVAWINFFNSCVNFTLMFAVVIFHKYIVLLASVTLIFGIGDLILYRIFIKKHLPGPGLFKGLRLGDLGLVWNILKQGWPFALLVGFSAIYNRVDVIIITHIKGFIETGLYTTAYRVFDLLNFFPSVVSFTLFPFFAALMARGALSDVRANLEKYMRLMAALAIPMAVGGMILSAKIIGLITNGDPKFTYSAAVLSILIWAPAIQFIYIPLNSLVISQLTKKALMITGANVIINIVGNLILIPLYGIKAAAIMTVISEALQGIFYFYFVRGSIVRFTFVTNLFRPLLAAAVMGLALWPLREMNLAVSLSVGVLIYGFLLVATGFVGRGDLAIVKQLFSRNNETVA